MELIGSWRLVHWRRTHPDGTITFPLGDDAVGMIIYAADGGMSATMTAAVREPVDGGDPLGGDQAARAAAYSTCLAYFGTWESDGTTVTHHVIGSLFPTWSGTVQPRPIDDTDGHLVLRTPTSPDGVVNEMAWARSQPATADAATAPAAPAEQSTTTRALTAADAQPTARVGLSYADLDLGQVAQHLYALMLRNVSSDGFPFTDSTHTLVSSPGCVIAAPSYPANAPGISQDYVFNWVRDAAITVNELIVAISPRPDEPMQALDDYVLFADLCQRNAEPTKGHACFTIDGRSRPWSEQNDGPAIQTSTILSAYAQLAPDVQRVADDLIARNLAFLLEVYRDATTNLWEEHVAYSFFARSVQLKCFRDVAGNTVGVAVPDGVAEAISWLEGAIAAHWNGSVYATMIGGDSPGDAHQSAAPDGYDPNIDIVQAAVYGAVPVTDTKVLATAALLLQHWADPDSPDVYPVNLADAALGWGPMLGRYPGDLYDGGSDSLGDHPWALCTANFAELCFLLATEIEQSQSVPLDELSEPFFTRLGVTASTSAADAAEHLRGYGEAMLRAVMFHSDHLELSEQYDGVSGFEKSVRDLTWSYASFLSAVRARTGQPVYG